MTDPIELAKELKQEIDKLPLFQEYLRIKDLLEKDESVNSLKKEIALAKQNGNNELHKELLNKYNSHPIVTNYSILQNEVYEYLKQVTDIINKK